MKNEDIDKALAAGTALLASGSRIFDKMRNENRLCSCGCMDEAFETGNRVNSLNTHDCPRWKAVVAAQATSAAILEGRNPAESVAILVLTMGLIFNTTIDKLGETMNDLTSQG